MSGTQRSHHTCCRSGTRGISHDEINGVGGPDDCHIDGAREVPGLRQPALQELQDQVVALDKNDE